MANTISTLSYANTFGDWVVATNAVVKENNDLAANNYVKPSGTLYLSDPTLGLQSGNTIVTGQLSVQGIGSSAYIQNNLRVDTQTYLTNTQLSLVASGQANVGGLLLALGSGTGLIVANTANVGGQLNVTGAARLGNTLTVAGKTQINNELTVTGNTLISNSVHISGDTHINNTLSVLAITDISGYASVYYDLSANNVVTGNNTHTQTLDVTNTATVNVLQANSTVNTTTISVVNTAHTNNLTANNRVTAPIANAGVLSVSSTTYTKDLVANTSLTVPTANVSLTLDANAASGFFKTLETTGQVSVGGNFIINGATVYSTNTFTLSANATSAVTSFFNVNRGSSGANASIRWNEASKYWDILDVNTGGSYSKVLTANLISDSVISTSQSNIASSNAANILNNTIITANNSMKSYVDTANTSLKSYVDTANTSMKSYVDTANTSMKSYVDGANTSMKSYVDSRSTANIAENAANLYFTTARARASISATGSLSYSNTTGVVSFTQGNTDTVSEGATNLYFTTSRARGSISATGSLSYSNTTGVMSFTQGNTDTITEGTTNKYYTDTRARASISVSGSLAYNSSTGVISYTYVTPNTTSVSEGTNLYYTDARARAAVSASGSLSYNSSTGVFSYTTPSTSGITEGTNLYYTNARARAAVSASGSLSYDSATGVFSFSQATINYSNDSNSTYQVLWGSGSTGFYGTAGIYVNPFYDNIYANGDIVAYASSDKQFKENVRDIPDALAKVEAIGGKLFDWTDKFIEERGGDSYHHQKEDLGVIAQDVEAVLPVAVRTRGDGSLAVNYEKMVALAFQAIKELKAEVEELKKQLP
jgi:hypothetical protein